MPINNPWEPLVDEVLKELHKQGALKDLVLIGSWCIPVYEELYNVTAYPLVTQDMDWLLHNPRHIIAKADIHKMLKDLAYEPLFDSTMDLVKYTRDEFTIEFLAPKTTPAPNENGRVVKAKNLNLSAMTLKYMDIPARNHMTVTFKGLQLKVPTLPAYVLHKAIVSPLRTKPAKKIKDARAVKDFASTIINTPSLGEEAINLYQNMPKAWKKDLATSLTAICPELHSMLTQK
jgi:hypothetical protein